MSAERPIYEVVKNWQVAEEAETCYSRFLCTIGRRKESLTDRVAASLVFWDSARIMQGVIKIPLSRKCNDPLFRRFALQNRICFETMRMEDRLYVAENMTLRFREIVGQNDVFIGFTDNPVEYDNKRLSIVTSGDMDNYIKAALFARIFERRTGFRVWPLVRGRA